ncbi:MAG: hypothetical protein RLO50_16285 [Azospirillaceae bacterium]
MMQMLTLRHILGRAALGVLALAVLAPASALACSCMAVDAETLLRQGHTIARVEVTELRMPASLNGQAQMTARLVESYTGEIPASGGGELTIATGANSAMCGLPIEAGESATVVLHPETYDADGKEASYSINLCSSLGVSGMGVSGSESAAVLEDFAARRASGEGVWVDTVRFRALIAQRPTLDALAQAFPEVHFVGPDQIATMELRFDQSRFFAELDADGRVVGGRFQ